jgi:hypothetical protein
MTESSPNKRFVGLLRQGMGRVIHDEQAASFIVETFLSGQYLELESVSIQAVGGSIYHKFRPRITEAPMDTVEA